MPKITESSQHPMLRIGTPLEYYEEFGLWIKREDLACLPPGPQFSKTRGVWARVRSRPEGLVGALDTYHSQAGHAVARACQLLGKRCIVYYPEFKHEPGPRAPQLRAQELGATLVGLPAGRSAILFHQARKLLEEQGGYMMPNALKLTESVTETAREYPLNNWFERVIIPASSGTIAAGVILGSFINKSVPDQFVIHMGYSRSQDELRKYLIESSGCDVAAKLTFIDEGYAYKDQATAGLDPPWPCNAYYDLKAFRWWMKFSHLYPGKTLFWNIG